MKKYMQLLLVCGCIAPVTAQLPKVAEFNLPKGENARCLAFTVNSRRLIAGGDKGSVVVFEVPRGDSWMLPGHQSKIISVVTSFDNRFVAYASEDGSISIYDLQESKSLNLNGATGIVKAVAFSPAGGSLATASEDGKISVWDMGTREKVSTMQGRNEKMLSLSFSPDGRLLASGSADHEIMLWNVETEALITPLTGHKDWVRAVSFSWDGKSIASASYDKTIRLWDVSTQKVVKVLDAHKDWGLDVRFSPDNQYVLTSGADGRAVVWNREGMRLHEVGGLAKYVCISQFSFDGKYLASADLSNAVKLFSAEPLSVAAWKPYDVTPPSIAVISPRLVSTKDAMTGFNKSVVHQSKVRILVEVTDVAGISEVTIDGAQVEPLKDFPDRYQLEAAYPVNSERTLAIRARDNSGNVTEEKLIIEHRRFTGTVDGSKYHALLIAVQDYKDEEIVDLDKPIEDMHRFKTALLKNYAFEEGNVSVLENPDRNTLYAKLDELQARLDKIDNLVIFYAGHGYWDPQLQQGYWLPSDAEPNKRSTWLSNGTLRDYIGGMNARHTLLVTDACFSGAIFKSRAVFENATAAIETLYLRKSRKAMTSGTLETVPDKSVFIDFLVKRLEENQEPYITSEELFSSLRKEVINNSPNNQVPQYGEIGQTGDEGGEFIFIKKG